MSELVRDRDIAPSRPVTARRPRWWLEASFAVAFYYAYAQIRDAHGRVTAGHTTVARHHGLAVLDVERMLHIDVEHGLQHVVLPLRWLVRILDVFYGTAHFTVTVSVFVGLLFLARPQHFRFWRNVLAAGTALALVGFALYPTMPPRLLAGHHYVDSMSRIGGLWSYNNGVIEHISDPYAAMPSLHVVWSMWCVAALWSLCRPRLRPLLALYPALTCFTILVTGTHWLLDLVAGAFVFGLALTAVTLARRWLTARRSARDDPVRSG